MLDGTLDAELVLPYVKRLCMTVMTTSFWNILVCMWRRGASVQEVASLIYVSVVVHHSTLLTTLLSLLTV